MNVTLALDMDYMKVKLQRGAAQAHNAIFFLLNLSNYPLLFWNEKDYFH